MEINLILAIVLVFILFVILPSITIFICINNKHILKILGILYFVIYLLGLVILTFSKVVFTNKEIIITFITNNKWFSLNFLWANFSASNILLNLVMLFPVGAFIISLNTKKGFIKTIIVSFVISLIIEILQFILPVNRTTEVLDIVLNVISGIIGYAYFNFVFLFSKRYEVNLLN